MGNFGCNEGSLGKTRRRWMSRIDWTDSLIFLHSQRRGLAAALANFYNTYDAWQLSRIIRHIVCGWDLPCHVRVTQRGGEASRSSCQQ